MHTLPGHLFDPIIDQPTQSSRRPVERRINSCRNEITARLRYDLLFDRSDGIAGVGGTTCGHWKLTIDPHYGPSEITTPTPSHSTGIESSDDVVHLFVCHFHKVHGCVIYRQWDADDVIVTEAENNMRVQQSLRACVRRREEPERAGE